MQNSEIKEQEPEFDEFAEDYDSELKKGLSISGEDKDYFAKGRIQWLKKRLAGIPTREVLDFGCGTGSATPFFFELLGIDRLLGQDPSEKSLSQARTKWSGFSAEFFQAPPADSPAVDLAFCNGVFHHIPPEFREEAMESVFSQVKPGGYFAFFENNPWNPITRLAMSRVPFDADAILVWPGEARKLLQDAGFEVRHKDFLFFFPRALAWLRPLEPFLRWIPFGGQYLILCQKP
ncbi:MAG: class I SAM-dependent methyltransferase [Verrucomicrobiales bacterium]|nr:class I SAM-dependent methyltransferase [Verrucomicrobiales bacterium]